MVEGFSCKFSLLNYYSDYKILARNALDLKQCDQLALEFANREKIGHGVDDESRPGYLDLRSSQEHGYQGEFGVGVLHVYRFEGEGSEGAKAVDGFLLESPELVRNRIVYASEVLGADRVSCNPDCGGRRLPWPIYYEKLKALAKCAEMASGAIGG